MEIEIFTLNAQVERIKTLASELELNPTYEELAERFFYAFLTNVCESESEKGISKGTCEFQKETFRKLYIFFCAVIRILKLIAALSVSKLPRTVLDYKIVFRTKINIFFKNLDDTHAGPSVKTHFITELLDNYMIIKWNTIKLKTQSRLLITYYKRI